LGETDVFLGGTAVCAYERKSLSGGREKRGRDPETNGPGKIERKISSLLKGEEPVNYIKVFLLKVS